MKKYTLFSFVFILSLILLGSFGIKSAKAWDSGCSAAGPYSVTTGALCSTTVTRTDCAVGDLYSYLTGEPCGTTTTTSTTPVISSLSPVSGTFSIGSNVNVFGSGFVPANGTTNDIISNGLLLAKASSFDGTSLTFTIPSSAGAYCPSETPCPQYAMIITTGVYPLKIVNANGTSNTVNFTITSGTFPPGCTSNTGYSTTTGVSCGGTVATSSPTISGVSGPQTLNVNQQGTWTVKASDSSNGNLSYDVDWGDAAVAVPMSAIVYPFTSKQSSATFTHTYTVAGSYIPTFIVTNTSGLTAQTSLSVVVGSGTTTQTITVTSPNGGEQWAQGTTHTITWKDSTRGTFCTYPYTCTSTTAPTPYNIVLTDSSSVPRTVASSVSGSSYSWAIPICSSINPCSSNFSIPTGSYTISVCSVATNVCGISNQFSIISGTETAVLSSISQVQNLTATVSGNSSVNLSWSAATATNGFGVYNIYRSTTSGFTPSPTNIIAQGNTLSYTDSGLSAGTYYYAVALRDLPGNVGPASAQVIATVGSTFHICPVWGCSGKTTSTINTTY